jgi:hypothetical protein
MMLPSKRDASDVERLLGRIESQMRKLANETTDEVAQDQANSSVSLARMARKYRRDGDHDSALYNAVQAMRWFSLAAVQAGMRPDALFGIDERRRRSAGGKGSAYARRKKSMTPKQEALKIAQAYKGNPRGLVSHVAQKMTLKGIGKPNPKDPENPIPYSDRQIRNWLTEENLK